MPSLRQLLGLSKRIDPAMLQEGLKKLHAAGAEEGKRSRKEIDKLRKALESKLGSLGAAAHAAPGTMAGMIKRLHQQGPDFATLIDIGASDGQWSRLAMEWFPQKDYLLVEAQPVHGPALESFTAGKARVQVAMAAAGSSQGSIHFDASDPFGGIASPTPFPQNNITVPVTTLDHEVSSRALPGPYLIKFDTHGFEVPILEGAAEVLKQTAVIIMECYNFKISPDCLTYPEMCAYLGRLGFRCVDMADVIHREKDGALWQMDIAFIREEAAVFADNNYR